MAAADRIVVILAVVEAAGAGPEALQPAVAQRSSGAPLYVFARPEALVA